MAWEMTAPPSKSFAKVDEAFGDLLAIRTDGKQTEFLVAVSESTPKWVPLDQVEQANVVDLRPK
jgi:hypothetical protein